MATKEALFKDSLLSDREQKNLDILDVIRRKSPLGRTDITRLTGINIVTVSRYVDNFVKQGIAYERGYGASSGGRKPTLVELNPKGFYCAGVDIGPRNLIAAITDLAGGIIAKAKQPRPSGRMDEVITSSTALIHEVIEKSNVEPEKIRGIGLGISGVIDGSTGTVRDTDPVRGITSTNYLTIQNQIEREFNIPVYVGNDATAAAYSEKWLTLDPDVENMLFVFSDVGCGIIIKGDIYTGSGGCAGEVQFNLNVPILDKLNLIDKDGRSYFRAWGGIDSGITEDARKAIKEDSESKIKELAAGAIDSITTETVIEAAMVADPLAIQLIENAGVNLGVRIAYLINLFNPEVVVIGGGIEKAGEFLFSTVKKTVKALAFEEPAAIAKIVPSRLGEDAVCLGASLLVMREVSAEI